MRARDSHRDFIFIFFLFKQIYIPCDRGAYIIDAQSIGKRERKKISFLEDEEERKKREGDPRQRIHARARKRIKHKNAARAFFFFFYLTIIISFF